MAAAPACYADFSADTMRIYQGDSYAGEVPVTNAADGSPADLTGYTALCQLRRQVADLDPVVAASFTTFVENSTVYLSLDKSITRLLQARYVYDVELTAPDGTVSTVLWGDAIVVPEVTRPMP